MKNIEFENIIIELKILKKLDTYSLVYLIDIPRTNDLSDLDKNINNNDIYIYIRNYSRKPLIIGEQFEILVPLSNPLDYIEMPISVKYFSMNRKIKIDKLYDGFSAIALLEFSKGIPSIVYEMKEYMSKNEDNNETFYLMNKKLWDEIVNWKR